MLQGPTRRQHVVSQVLLRRWTDGNGDITAISRYGHARPARPAKEGYVLDLLQDDYDRHEAIWQQLEDRAPAVFSAVEAGVALSQPAALETLIDLAALHWARSHQMMVVYEHTLLGAVSKHRSVLSNAELDAAFRVLPGLEPVGEDARRYVRSRLAEVLASEFQPGGAFFAERIDDNFDRFKMEIDGWPIQIRRPRGGEYLIGDCPVQTYNHRGRSGVLHGVSVDRADEILFPLGPGHVMAFTRTGATAEVASSAEEVERMNTVQVHNAHRAVYARPGSGLEKLAASAWASRPPPESL